MYSRSFASTSSKKVLSFSGNFVGCPTASQCQSPPSVFTYKSTPLTPVAAKCGIARFSPVNDHLTFKEGASVVKRTYMPEVCWLKRHTEGVTLPSALAGSLRKKSASVGQPRPCTWSSLTSIHLKPSAWPWAKSRVCTKKQSWESTTRRQIKYRELLMMLFFFRLISDNPLGKKS